MELNKKTSTSLEILPILYLNIFTESKTKVFKFSFRKKERKREKERR
jgi:hypothetical protein